MTANGRRRLAMMVGWSVSAMLPSGLTLAEGYVSARMAPNAWQVAGEAQAFQADNLFEQIDGAAPGYLRYSFRLLTVQSVQLDDDPKTQILVEVYEFGNHLDAFGIYSNERTPKLAYVKLGAEGYYAGPSCRFYKGSYYVKLAASRDSEQVQVALKALATSLARRLKGETRPPALLKAIPREGVIANSERYEGSDLLAHEFLGPGFTADYDLGGDKPAKLFFAIKADRWEARDAYYQLLSFLRQRGEVGETVGLAQGTGRMTRHPFYGPSLVCRSGAVVCGVLRIPNTEAGAKLVNELLGNLQAALPLAKPWAPGACCGQ